MKEDTLVFIWISMVFLGSVALFWYVYTAIPYSRDFFKYLGLAVSFMGFMYLALVVTGGLWDDFRQARAGKSSNKCPECGSRKKSFHADPWCVKCKKCGYTYPHDI